MSTVSGPIVSEPEDPRLVARNLSVGTRLFVSATAFVFVAFVFAFFYLKAINSHGLWRPPHTNPTAAYGIVTLVCVVGTAAVFELARRGLRSGSGGWLAALAVSLVIAIAVVVLGVLQILFTKFSAYNGGGYASVFYGWISMFVLFWLGAVYWIESLLATGIRKLPVPEQPDVDPVRLLPPAANACQLYLAMLVLVEVFLYVLLYLVK
jgi:heme/copper-type cytochrome/quinol oxidase subunit 3